MQITLGITASHMKIFLLLYSDDVIFAASAEQLECKINKSYAYCDRWKLKVNSSKSHIVFKKGRMNTSERRMYGNDEITAVTKKSIPRSIIYIQCDIPPSPGHLVGSS